MRALRPFVSSVVLCAGCAGEASDHDDAWGNAIVLQSTGRIVIGGWSRNDGGKKRATLVRVLGN